MSAGFVLHGASIIRSCADPAAGKGAAFIAGVKNSSYRSFFQCRSGLQRGPPNILIGSICRSRETRVHETHTGLARGRSETIWML